MENMKFSEIISNYGLVYYTPEIDPDEVIINTPEVNRPALQLAGFFEHFDKERVQVIGNVECAFLDNMEKKNRVWVYDKLMSSGIPCLIICRGVEPDKELLEAAVKHGVPVATTEMATSPFDAELTRWLHVQLAPEKTIHGVLVDVYGEGVLIMGESGIGKSEAALELIKRGHRLVSDDVVIVKKVSDETLIGTSPDMTKHLIELRGIGVIDVKAISYNIPVRPGRNVAVIVESASVNHRQKMLGYNAAQELERRVEESFSEDK